MGTTLVKCRIKRPTQLVKGPGKMGKKLPKMPKTINTSENEIKKMSI